MAQTEFVDEVQVNLRGGDGGAGAASFRRESHVPKGGPDGGDGGSGGDVLVVADHNTASLLSYRDHPHRRAESGKHGSGQKRHGASGKDLVVSVPEGTIVLSRDGEILADLVSHGAPPPAAVAAVAVTLASSPMLVELQVSLSRVNTVKKFGCALK